MAFALKQPWPHKPKKKNSNMSLRLTTDPTAIELSSLESKLARDHIKDVIEVHLAAVYLTLSTAIDGEVIRLSLVELLGKALGASNVERLLRNVAGNVVQSLI